MGGFDFVTLGWQSWDGSKITNYQLPIIKKANRPGLVLFGFGKQTVLEGMVPGDKKTTVLKGSRESVLKEFLRRTEKNLKYKYKKCKNFFIYYTWPEFGRSVTARKVYDEIRQKLGPPAKADALASAGRYLGGQKKKIFLLDDGWERAIGDWEVKYNFGETLDVFAKNIKQMGYVPGLWLAPFLRNDRKFGDIGRVRIGIERFVVIDPKKSKKYFYDLGRQFSSLGFSFFKLDFFYAGLKSGDLNSYRECLKSFRKGAGRGAVIMGCGAPILESLGLFDMVRGSSDSTTYPFWTFGKAGAVINFFLKKFRVNERMFIKSFESFFLRKKYFGELENFVADGLVWGEKYGIGKKLFDKFYKLMVKESVITFG